MSTASHESGLAVSLALAQAVGRTTKVAEICEAALDAARDGLGINRAAVLLSDGDGVMRFRAWRGLSDPYRDSLEGYSPWEPHTRDARPVVVPEVSSDGALLPYLHVFAAEGIAAVAFVPLVYLETLAGMLMLCSAKPCLTTPTEVTLAAIIAAQVSPAIRHTAAEEAARQSEERLTDEFLAALSHELRTPLNAIVGWVHMLQNGGVPPTRTAKALDVIARNARLQSQLIEDMLDVSRILAKQLQMDRVPVSIAAVLAEAVAAVHPSARANRIKLLAKIPRGLPPVEGDPHRLQQVFTNLLANAVKFTPEGGQVAATGSTDGANVVVEIRDSGIGIDPDFLPHFFERFRQADDPVHRQQSGLGLGLAIAQHLVEQHGGRLRVASDRGGGRGSTFTLELPVMRVEARPGDPGAALASVEALDGGFDAASVPAADDEDARQTL